MFEKIFTAHSAIAKHSQREIAKRPQREIAQTDRLHLRKGVIIDDVCLGLPRVISNRGILKTVNLDLSPREEEQLHHSAQVLQEVCNQFSF